MSLWMKSNVLGIVDFGAKMLTRINLSPKISGALEDW